MLLEEYREKQLYIVGNNCMLLEGYREKQLYVVGRVERETTVCCWKSIERNNCTL